MNEFTLNTKSTIDTNAIVMLFLGIMIAGTAIILIAKIAR